MNIEGLAIADGQIESVLTSRSDVDVIFVDWQEARWKLKFFDVLAIENLSFEGTDLDRLEIQNEDPYIQRARTILDEPDAKVSIYSFFTPWVAEPRLRIVAGSCNVVPLIE